jgi:hypothetical protein
MKDLYSTPEARLDTILGEQTLFGAQDATVQ